MQRTRLERAKTAIDEFRGKNKDCYGELVFLLYKYKDRYFDKTRFSLKYRHLFRIIADRTREEDINYRLYNAMKEDVDKIWRKYKDTFDDFSTLVERHVDMESNGYNAMARLMFGESVECILKETEAGGTQRQELKYEDIKKTIIENYDLKNTDIQETALALLEMPPVKDTVLAHPDYKVEVEHLEGTMDEMLKELNALERKSSEIYARQKGLLAVNDGTSRTDLNTYSNIQKGISKKLLEIESAVDSPYFGRVDFKEDDGSEFESLYIGKAGFKQDSKYGVIDWRMPISSVFYECENGRARYEAPGGTFSGDVKLKRQYTIRDSQLISFADDMVSEKIIKAIDRVDSKAPQPQKEEVISDPVLLEKLKQSSDKKLKDIIETIRAEQNKIIRQPLNKVLVVQGVAGSGKSTVGLHRISHLLYNNSGITPGKVLVLAPNKVFLDYISELLPGIDAKGVTQFTFEQLAFQLIGTSMEVSRDEKIEFFVSVAQENLYRFLKDAMTNISRFKGSLSFISLIKYIVNKKTNEISSELKDIRLFDAKLKISREEQAEHLTGNAPLNHKLMALKRAVESKVKIYVEQKAYFSDNTDALRKEAAAFLGSYLKDRKPIEPISAYKELYEDDNVYRTLYKNRYFSFAAQYTLKILESGRVEREDLAALCYIKYMTDGISAAQKYLHIFVDEAQDLSPLEFSVLKLVSENNSLTIMGDMNQGVNSHRGIDNWEQLTNDIYSDLKPLYFEILHSYRSTREIVEFSNTLIPQNLPKAKLVARNGEKPVIEKVASYKDGINKIIKMIKYYKSKGCQSIGVLAKREKECKTIYAALAKLGNDLENINLIDDTTGKYGGGVSVAPIVLSKGLEFDAVILWNASDEVFNDTGFDLKILYVALTRSMHYLYVLYKGNITKHLKDFAVKDTDIVRASHEAEKDSFIDKRYKEFINSPEYREIEGKRPKLLPLITRLIKLIKENKIPAYPAFRKEHESRSEFRVFNFKLQNPKRQEWDNLVTVVPNKNNLKVFTYHDGKPGDAFILDSVSIKDQKYMKKLLDELLLVYKFRT